MKTIFEQHMDMFTDTIRPDIEEWIHINSHGREGYISTQYRFKPMVYLDGYKAPYNGIKVTMNHDASYGPPYENGINYLNIGLLAEGASYSTVMIFTPKYIPTGGEEVDPKIEDLREALAWNPYVNIPSDMIEHIIAGIKDFIA